MADRHTERGQTLQNDVADKSSVSERAKKFFVSCGHIAEGILLIVFAPLHLFIMTAPAASPMLRGYIPVTGGWSWLTAGLPEQTITAADQAMFQIFGLMWGVSACVYLLYRLVYWFKYPLPEQRQEYEPITIWGAWEFARWPGVLLLVWTVFPLGALPALAVFVVAYLSTIAAIEWRLT